MPQLRPLDPEFPIARQLSAAASPAILVNIFTVAAADEAALLAAKAHIEAQGIDVLGPTYHGIFRSIYFFDPNGHRLELACNIGTAAQYAKLRELAPAMLDEWSRTRRAPRHAAWLHEDPAERGTS